LVEEPVAGALRALATVLLRVHKSLRQGEIYAEQVLFLIFLSGLVVLIFRLVAAYWEVFPEWSKYQADYEPTREYPEGRGEEESALFDFRGSAVIPQRPAAYRPVHELPSWASKIRSWKSKDIRSSSTAAIISQTIPGKFDAPSAIAGQGRATNRKEAHGLGTKLTGTFPSSRRSTSRVPGVQCHDAGTLKAKGWDSVAKGEKLVNQKKVQGLP
jgi:hypothetical protein